MKEKNKFLKVIPKDQQECVFCEKKDHTVIYSADKTYMCEECYYKLLDIEEFTEKHRKSKLPYIEADLQGCEACERFADIELMHSHGDVYICQICKDSTE